MKELARNRWSSIWALTIIFLAGCKAVDDKTPDVRNIFIKLNVRRLDRDLARLDTNQLNRGLVDLQKRYPDFLSFYLDTLMGFNINGNFADTSIGVRKNFKSFLTHPDYRGLFDTVATHFPNTEHLDAQILHAFKYMKFYLPDFTPPKIIYCVSGLNNYAAFTLDSSIVGVGLDMYLGEQYPFYAAVGIPAYASQKLKPAYIPINVMQSIYRLRYPFVMEQRSLLDMMIQLGKEQFFLSKVVPFAADTARLGYTKQQLAWCEENETQAYHFFVQEKLLYERSLQKVARYVMDGPYAAGMPKESPGNIGAWIGFRIVTSYVNKHPVTDLRTFLKHTDAQQFLEASGYRP